MKNIYLVQPSNILSGEIFLPYAAGAIAAYAWQFEDIRTTFHLGKIFFKKEPFQDVLAAMKSPFLVGFSCYMWNVEYNLALAQRVKQRWPNSVIAFGGPQVPDDTTYLSDYPFIDVLMHGEGEKTFHRVLLDLATAQSLSNIPNLSFRNELGLVHTKKELNHDLSAFPSPYLSGVFDEIVHAPENANLRFDAVLETNRGCPYSCIYCYWAGTEQNFRQFSMEKIKADLLWMAKNRIVYCICADSNFGILERDQETVEYLISLKEKYGFPQKFETSSAKEKNDAVFQINKALDQAGLNCGISVAVQSFSSDVLERIGRKNMSIRTFETQIEKYRKAGMSPYTDFILGLPGETFTSFCSGIFAALEAGQHKSINIHPCEVLPNTILYLPQTREKYGIETIVSTHYQEHTTFEKNQLNGSRSEIIVATNTMKRQEWKRAMQISICVQSFHSFGLLKYIAIYLRKAQEICYEDFYTRLFTWIESESHRVRALLDEVCHNIDLFLEGKSGLFYYNPIFANAYLSFKEGLFLRCAYDQHAFYEELKPFLQSFFTDRLLFDDLYLFQQRSIMLPSSKDLSILFQYDWKDYFDRLYDKDNLYPQKEPTLMATGGCKASNWKDYTKKYIWYGKRENKMLRVFHRSQQKN